MPDTDDPPPPQSTLRQSVLGSYNTVIGSVGPGANINVNFDHASKAATDLLQSARVAYHGGKAKDAVSLAATSVEELRRLKRPQDLELALLTVGYASVESYKSSRDQAMLTKYAIPSFTELSEIWAEDPASDAKRAECFAYLAWCQHWLTNNEYVVGALVTKTTDLLGENADLSRWAKRALRTTKIESNVKFAAGFTGGLIIYAILAILAVSALGWVLNQLWK